MINNFYLLFQSKIYNPFQSQCLNQKKNQNEYKQSTPTHKINCTSTTTAIVITTIMISSTMSLTISSTPVLIIFYRANFFPQFFFIWTAQCRHIHCFDFVQSGEISVVLY